MEQQAVNPFTNILVDFSIALFGELNEIKKTQEKILSLLHSPHQQDEAETVDVKQAAKFLHLGEDRLYAIHGKYFNTLKQRKKLLFYRKELVAYLHGNLPVKEITKAAELRIEKNSENKLRVVSG